MSQFQGPPVPVKNVGTVEIPPFGVVISKLADVADSENNPLVETEVISPSGNTQEAEDGTFQSNFHYHSLIGFAAGGKITARTGRGTAYFGLEGPIRAATETDDIQTSDILIATTDSAKLRKLDRGTPGTPGDFTNIFGMFKPLKKLSSKLWIVSFIRSPIFAARAADDADEGEAAVAEILQHGDAEDESIDVEFDSPIYISFFAKDAVSEDDKIMVGLVAGALVRIGGGGSSNSGGDGSDSCGSCDNPIPVGSTIVGGKKYAFTYGYTSPADDVPAGEVDRNEDDANWQADSFEVECVADVPPEDPEE